ncbi:hypothetical protein ACP4OV_019901 [Aristida adscensionis]
MVQILGPALYEASTALRGTELSPLAAIIGFLPHFTAARSAWRGDPFGPFGGRTV